MSIEEAAEIFACLEKDPISDELTYAEVKQFIMDKVPNYSKTKADWPIPISSVDTSRQEV